jgi:hypothetical protein
MLLKFSKANAKLTRLEEKTGKRLYSFALPSGYTCPFAEKCLSKVVTDKATGKKKLVDGPNTEFRCYSASQEVLYPTVYNLVNYNFNLLRQWEKGGGFDGLVHIISISIPKNAGIIRIHESGDFYNPIYFKAWCAVARSRPDIRFYAYTKSIPYWIGNKHLIPANLKLTASFGGRADSMIELHDLNNVKVVYSQYEARKLKRPIDKTDFHAYNGTKQFSLLIHNSQPKGSKASAAWQRVKKTAGGYSRKKVGV